MRYRTIVADPPWPYNRQSRGFPWRNGQPSGDASPMLTYPTMTITEIADLPVDRFAEEDAHLYLWTTQRYLWKAREIAQAWNFKPSTVLVWCKPPTGFSLGDAFGKATEFALFCRRGKLAAKSRINRDWWEWSRSGHSKKPEAFLDLVESVSPGPYLELFARRNRLGWDTWGNESLEMVEMP